MAAIVKFVIAAILGFAALPWCINVLLGTARGLKTWAPEDPEAIVIGLAAGLLFLFWSRPNAFVHTFVHECCHAAACLVLGVRLHGFSVTARQGGAVEHDPCDPLRGILIAIAPYTLPLILLPLLLAQTLTPAGPWRQILSGLCAWAYVSHLQGLLLNIRNNFWGRDCDLAKTGRPLGLVLICACFLLLSALVLLVLWTSPVLPWTRPR